MFKHRFLLLYSFKFVFCTKLIFIKFPRLLESMKMTAVDDDNRLTVKDLSIEGLTISCITVIIVSSDMKLATERTSFLYPSVSFHVIMH